jgi:hypothetical protein
MNKNFKTISMCIVAVAVLAISGYNVKMSMNSTTDALSATAMLNLAALARGENMGNGENPNGLTPEERENICRRNGGVWNHYSKVVNGGVLTVTSTGNGEASGAGFSFKGLRRNRLYMIEWELRSCEREPGECCELQGVKAEITPL